MTIGGTGVQTTGGNAPTEIRLTAGNLTLDEDITADGSGNVTIFLATAGTSMETSTNTDNLASTSGAISITADTLTLSTGTITTTGGAITLQPVTAARPVVIGAAGAATDFALTAAEIAR